MVFSSKKVMYFINTTTIFVCTLQFYKFLFTRYPYDYFLIFVHSLKNFSKIWKKTSLMINENK